MLHPHVTAVASAVIHGHGLVARAPIRAGEVVSRLDPNHDVYQIDDVLRMEANELDHVMRAAYQNSDTTMVAEHGDERFMNHSCDPNTWWLDDDTMTARRDIAAGEEITYDYATTDISIPYQMHCMCGSGNCRHIVTNLDYLDPQWQEQYGEHLPSHTLRAIAQAREAAQSGKLMTTE